MVKLLNGVRKNMAPLKKIDEAAKMWEKTKDPKYKDLWYKLIKEWAYDKNISNTNTTVRWNTSKRKTRFFKTNGSSRMSNVR